MTKSIATPIRGPLKVHLVVGARPNFVKVAPLHRLLREHPREFTPRLIHTGQHYDAQMSAVFFDDLDIPAPDVHLNVGSDTHGAQTGRIMISYEPTLLEDRPDLVLVFGDVNSTVACALVAVKQGVPVGHVEAGLRSFDRSMPEEINRMVTDAISDVLFTPSEDADANLLREGVRPDRIHCVGNIMIDSLVAFAAQIERSSILARHALEPRSYALLTLHRPGNVDDGETLRRILTAVEGIQKRVKIVFPAHPRTRGHLAALGFDPIADGLHNLLLLDPLGYRDFLKLLKASALVITDSGGVQEESTFLGIPCLTVRDNTERPVTIQLGTNRLVGQDPRDILAAALTVLDRPASEATVPDRWDGRTATRILDVLRAQFLARPALAAESALVATQCG